MLSNLSVRHLAVVDDIELSFNQGMTSLTGETGAGKSILVDALGLVLGDRADSNMVRHGCERAEIEASFNIDANDSLRAWLVEQELDDDDQCHLRRTISRDGRSQAYINGRKVPLTLLRAVSERTIDIHGQHAHQSLIRSETQRELLDTVAKTKPLLLAQLHQAYQTWQQLQTELNSLQQHALDQTARLELLRYQQSELEPLDLSEQNIKQLIEDQQQLAHASQLINAVESGLDQLYQQEAGCAYDLVSSVLARIEKLRDIEPKFNTIIESLNSAIVHLDDSGNELRHYLEHSDLDPTRLDAVESQLSILHNLARKHHIEIEDLPVHYQKLCDELDQLSNLDTRTIELEQAVSNQRNICIALCEQLSKQRQQAAQPLSEQITQTIQKLAISGGRVEFKVTPLAHDRFTETGADSIQLLVSTNPGQAAGELAKVASGGELARISLAIQVVTAGTRSVPTLVFDEVDVGIGGSVAEIIGQHLRKLGSTQQVICITHLPQVAAQAHQQIQVTKKQHNGSTYIELTSLDNTQRIEEIARMLGGVMLTDKTREHAKEMLEQAQN
ncbi:MAG: DNA repair protein RecN [Gammaproteobacteria bacterium]|nr:DNA repair protein RecN [Gammaproteobacteria bacterium]